MPTLILIMNIDPPLTEVYICYGTKDSLKILAVRLSITALFHNVFHEKFLTIVQQEKNICTCALLFGLKFKHFLIISTTIQSNTTMNL